MQPLVFNVQKYSIHDGAGIRTTVFFKGCPLTCAWCHNPESQAFRKELMVFSERCGGCGRCVAECPRQAATPGNVDRAVCAACGACVPVCASNARAVVGEEKTVEALAGLLERDRIFYELSGGGVTLSGGEPMAQDPVFLAGLLKRLKRRGCDTAVDTCGYASWSCFEAVLPYVDTFLFDLKLADPEQHRRWVGADNAIILENLRRLAESGAKVRIRVPVIGGVNDSDGEMGAMVRIAAERCPGAPVHLLPYHNTGRDKFERMGMHCRDEQLATPDQNRMEELADMWKQAGFTEVEIGG